MTINLERDYELVTLEITGRLDTTTAPNLEVAINDLSNISYTLSVPFFHRCIFSLIMFFLKFTLILLAAVGCRCLQFSLAAHTFLPRIFNCPQANIRSLGCYATICRVIPVLTEGTFFDHLDINCHCHNSIP